MIRCEAPQGSQDWLIDRLGIPTGSQFHRLLTPRLKPSASATAYLYELLADDYAPMPQGDSAGAWADRGIEMEAEAVKWYEFDRDAKVEQVGFILTDDGKTGGSPDGLVGDDGGVEIKCKKLTTHIGYLLGEDEHAHRCQCQGYLWLTGRKWWDLVFYNPVLPPVVRRYEPEQEWLDAFLPELEAFQARLSDARTRLRDEYGLKVRAILAEEGNDEV